MAEHFKSPLTIYVLWHPKFSEGGKLADRLFNTLCRNVNDPFARPIGIPVYYRSAPAGPGSETPAPIPLEESDYNAIVVFVDTQMLLSDDWTEYVKEVLAQEQFSRNKTRVFPMANDFAAFKSQQLGAINYIRMYEADKKDDEGMVEDETVGVDDSAIRQREADLQAREAELQAREAMLAVREKVSTRTAAASGVSVGVGQPTVQGDGININITINHPGSGGAGHLAAVNPAATTATSETAAKPADRVAASVASADMKVDKVPAKSASFHGKSAEEFLRRRGNQMMSKLVHELCRLIISPPTVDAEGTTASAKPVNLFLSHAKADGAEIAKAIKNYIEEDSSMKTFFDANDIAPGYRFSDELKRAIKTSALICIQTDFYATREWCLFEVITAKRYDRPVVALNAVEQREPRSFPYIGNVPTTRWNPKDKSRFRAVVDSALFEVLNHTYSDMYQKAVLKLYDVPGVQTVGHAPELFTILKRREEAKKKEEENETSADAKESTKYLLYPDPPLGDEEIKLLQDLSPDMRFITPTMLPVIEHLLSSK